MESVALFLLAVFTVALIIEALSMVRSIARFMRKLDSSGIPPGGKPKESNK
jgi:hypothetical protein